MKKRVISLSELNKNTPSVICGLRFDHKKNKRMAELGLTEGTIVTIVKRSPFFFPVALRFRGYELCLSKSECDKISVEVNK